MFIQFCGIYINIHNKVKDLKYELSVNISDLNLEKTKIILDTDFIQKKNKIIKRYSLLLLIPLIIATLVGIYVLVNYSSIPDTSTLCTGDLMEMQMPFLISHL